MERVWFVIKIVGFSLFWVEGWKWGFGNEVIEVVGVRLDYKGFVGYYRVFVSFV